MSQISGILNLPNCLSFFRILLVPVFWVTFFSWHRYAGLVVYGLACLTDVLDGAIARRRGQITRLGQWLDPAADKLMTIIVATALALYYSRQQGRPEWLLWGVTLGLAIKELLMGIGGLFVYFRKSARMIFPAQAIGKIATATLFAGLVLTFFREYLMHIDQIALILGAGVSLIAFIYYAYDNLKAFRKATKSV